MTDHDPPYNPPEYYMIPPPKKREKNPPTPQATNQGHLVTLNKGNALPQPIKSDNEITTYNTPHQRPPGLIFFFFLRKN